MRYAAAPRLLLGAALLFAAPAASQTTPTARDSATRDSAVLIVHGRPIAVFRASHGASDPHERAAAARQRLDALAEAETRDTVRVTTSAEGALVSVGGRAVFVIVPADLDTVRGQTVGEAAAEAAAKLRVALAGEVEQRSFAHFLRSLGLAAAATLLFLIALRLLRYGHRIALARLHATPHRRRTISVRGFTLLDPQQILAFVRRLVDLVAWSAGLFLGYLWLFYVLTRFAYSRPWGEALGGYLVSTLSSLGEGAVSAVPGLFTVVIIVLAARFVTRLVSTFFAAVEKGDVALPWVHAETAQPTRRIVTGLLWVFALVVAYPYLPGSGSDVFKGVSVFIGVMISLGSTGLVNQAMSGLVLMYARALKPGDYVQAGPHEGIVTSLGLLATKLSNNRREVITIPNSVMVSQVTTNYSSVDDGCGAALATTMTIGYDTPWRQVEALMLEAARRTPGVLGEPAPFLRVAALQDFYVEYQFSVFLERPEARPSVRTALHQNLLDCFNEYGVQIMSPHYEGDPPAPKVVPKARWFATPARGDGQSAVLDGRLSEDR